MAGDNSRYWDRVLLPNERALHIFGISRWYLFVFWILPGMLFIWLSFYLLLVGNLMLAAFSLIVPVFFLIAALVQVSFVHYLITDSRVMSRIGVLHKTHITIDLRSITDVEVFEAFWERILTRTGVIRLNTAGSDHMELTFRHVAKPFELRKDIYRHQQELLQKTAASGLSNGPIPAQPRPQTSNQY